MIKKVGLLLLVLWGLSFSTTLHLTGSLYRFIKSGFVFAYRLLEAVVSYRPLRHASSLAVFLFGFAGISGV